MLMRRVACMFWRKFFHITDKAYLNSLSQAGTIGLHMVSGIVVGTLIGYFLDQWLATSPWLTGIFLLLGICAGFKNVYVDTKRLIATQKREEEEARQRPSSQNTSGPDKSGKDG